LLVVGRDEIFVIDAKTNWRVRRLAYGESRMERMRSVISTSVTCTPAEGLEAIESTVISPYRYGLLFIYQSAFDQNLTVFPEDPRG
jgi:hypothetical protein